MQTLHGAVIERLAKKAASGIAAVKGVRQFVPPTTLHLVYKTLIQPHFDYSTLAIVSCIECAESLFMEINRPKEKNIIVGVVYRPPNQELQDFMNSLDLLLASISKENKICYVVGDWNLDLIKHHCHE